MVSEPELLSRLALGSFRLNGIVLGISDQIVAGGPPNAAPLTTARWQVLGAVLGQALTVPAIARVMGTSRQATQRTADLLVADGLAAYEPNPAHKRSPLLRVTEAGVEAVRALNPRHALAAGAVAQAAGRDVLERAVVAIEELADALAGVEVAEDVAAYREAREADDGTRVSLEELGRQLG